MYACAISDAVDELPCVQMLIRFILTFTTRTQHVRAELKYAIRISIPHFQGES